MNILLVYPAMPATFWTMRDFLKISGKKAMYPPLSVLTVASLLPQHWNRKLIDLNVTNLKDADLQWADYLFLSAMNVQEHSAAKVIERAHSSGLKIVAGGPLFFHEYHRFSKVDHFLIGEAEITLPLFIRDLQAGTTQPLYKAGSFCDIRHTPSAQWNLINPVDYQYGIVQYSRGCPYNCDFCDVTVLYGRKQRIKSTKQIIDELNILAKYDFPSVLFADDNLIGNKKSLKEDLLPALRRWRKEVKPSFSFGTQVSINLTDDPELMRMMLQAGFRHLFIGIETPDEETLLACKKGQNTKRDLMAGINTLHKTGFVIVGGFIIGFDTDTPTIFQRQIDFVQKSGIVLSTMNLLKAPPGTNLYKRMQAEGRLLQKFSFSETDTNFIPKMNSEVLRRGFKKTLKTLYSPQFSYRRAQKFLQEYQKPGRIETPIPYMSIVKYLGTLLRSIFYIGILGKERLYYWKLIFWSLRKRKDLLDWAFLNTLMIYQLRKLYDSYRLEDDHK